MGSVHQLPLAPKLNANCKHSKYIDLLSKLAVNVKPIGSARMASCIVYKNDIIAFGNNSNKTHPFQAKFSKNKSAVHLHAETDAIKNALRFLSTEELAKSTLYICRVKFFDRMKNKLIFGLAKPCDGCFKAINTFGISKVVYSLDNEGYALL